MRDYLMAIEWLLRSNDPSVRYLTLRDVVEKPKLSEDLRKARNSISRGEKVRKLLSGLEVEGGFSVHPYRKWTGSHWRLVSLVNLAVSQDNAVALKAAYSNLEWLHQSGTKWWVYGGTGSLNLESQNVIHSAGRKAYEPIKGRIRIHASVYGNAVGYWSYFGLARDQRVRDIVKLLLKAQWNDGGWNCDTNPDANHSSFHESLSTLNGLISFREATLETAVDESIDKAIELFLSHRIFRSHRTQEIIDGEWLKLRYPVYWHYNFLESMLVLCRTHRGRDKRMEDALDLLESKCNQKGQWEVEGHYWIPIDGNYLTSRRSLPSRELVDWGWSGPNEWITLNALRVLKAAGRLN